jgi:serine/threonine-protein kinase
VGGVCPRCHLAFEGDSYFCPNDGIRLADAHEVDRLGQIIGNYNLISILGRGGMGTVYKAENIYIGKIVAMKILQEKYAKQEEAVKRFLREARAASSINHPNIADVTDFGPAPDGCAYLVMEYVEGESLEDLLLREERLELIRAINIMNQVASALAAAHDRQIVHRDLKPENLLLTRRPGRREVVRRAGEGSDGSPKYVIEKEQSWDFVKVVDFGIAKLMAPEDQALGTSEGQLLGTPEFIAPEAVKGQEVDHRADIYALGVVFYLMLTGEVPFWSPNPVAILRQHVNEEPIPPRYRAPDAEITEAAEVLILRAMAKDPAQRQQSMDEMRTELAGCFGNVVYRRDAARLPDAAAFGLLPRKRSLTDELDEWLINSRDAPSPEDEPTPVPLTKRKSPTG